MNYLMLALLLLNLSCKSHESDFEHTECGSSMNSTELPLECKTQNVDGSWGEGENKRVKTSLILIRLLHEGKTPKSKIYGKTIIKAMKYLALVETKNIINKKENGFDAFLVLSALKASSNIVKAEELTAARKSLEKHLIPISQINRK